MRATAHATVLALFLLVMLPAAAAEGPGFRAVYGSRKSWKSWDDAQAQCRAWGGALAKVDTAEAQGRMRKIKCTDVLWVGAHENPKTPGVNPELWTWISDGSSVSKGVWQTGEPNNFKDKEEASKGKEKGRVPLVDVHLAFLGTEANPVSCSAEMLE